MIAKNMWIDRILSCIKEVASREYQERAWIKHEMHTPCSLEELICSFFDDCFIREFINEKMDEFKLSTTQKLYLSDFVSAFDQYTDRSDIYCSRSPLKIDALKVLSDPEWRKIQKMAQKVLGAFEDMKYDPANREDWLNSIFSGISHYSDVEEQKKMWVNRSETFFYTPRDLYDRLFMYADFDSFMDGYVEEIGLTEQQVEALKKFYAQIQITPFKTAEYEGILDDPQWKNLQTIARETLAKFPKA
ncbi:MAG: hypothetical protein KGQ49_02665 [Verrucomicrobia bacterium]|nr:hypothetical protein [Verrucomicrobiota bacterium]MBU6446285.1 hypothetical protein [Verrucomicrobiota bacterium]MDE3047658.1 hypothetical protein [Verrucomicrobiota bacterium]